MLSEKKNRRAELMISVMEGLSGANVRGTSHSRVDVIGRTLVASALLAEGWTEAEVGCVIKRNHATVNHYRRKMQAILHSPGYDYERELWNKFKKEI